jgi:hypothetical protein
MAAIETGNSTPGKVNVDDNFALRVTGHDDPVLAGFMALAAQSDDGAVTGTPDSRAIEATADYRTRVGLDSTMFNLSFEGTTIARAHLQQNDSTATAAQASGLLTINSGNSVTSGQGCHVRTWRNFPTYGSFTTYGELWAMETNPNATGAVSEWGFGIASGVTPQVTDGVFFRRASGGQLRAVVTNLGTDISDQLINTTDVPPRDSVGIFDPTEMAHYLVEMHNDEAIYWINDTIVAKIPCPAGFGNMSSSQQLPIFARVYNSGTASAARQLRIGYINVSAGEQASGKPWGHIQCGMGGGAYQTQPGNTSGPTVSRASGAAGWPASATARIAGTWTPTSAPALNSFGGGWVSPAISTLTSEADYPVFCFINPAGTNILPGKTLYVTGINWGKTVVAAAAATNPITLEYIVGVGASTAVTNGTEAAALIAARGVVLD